MDPYFYGGSKTRPAGNAAVRHAFELRMARECLDLGLPVLGICGGEQLINVLFGGTLLDDIPKRVPGALNHNADYLEISHGVDVPAGSMLRKAAGKRSFKVNSTHHQSVDRIGKGLVVSAIAPDGVVEAVEAVDGPWVLGVQWHPEALPGHEPSLGVFRAFIRAVEKRAGA
jgi:putative glutamine amidotransferase